jgi:hypothetical protein
VIYETKRNHADDIIDELVEKVSAAYPAKRLERIRAQSEDQWQYPNSVGGSLTLGAAPAAPEPAGGGSSVPDQPVVTAPVPTAPKTGDSGVLALTGLLAAMACAALITKRAGKNKA